MQPIHHEGVTVPAAVAIVSLAQMRVIVLKVIVAVFDMGFVGPVPERQCCDETTARQGRQHQGGPRKTNCIAQPPGKRIGYQPAGVRKCEVGGEECRAILRMR
jgi:hypothetical protein